MPDIFCRICALTLSALSLTACAEAIAVHGPIDAALAREIVGRIDASEAPTIRLDLESNGGWVEAGFDIIMAAERARSRARIVTRVRDHCHSICVALFLAGDERIADPDSSFILHAASDPDGRHQPVLTGWLLGYYMARGVDARWIGEQIAPKVLTSTAPLTLSGRQIAERLNDPS